MDIVEELRQDREKGAKRLESEYKAGLMSLALRFCHDHGDAEELVNRTFAAVIDGIDGYLEQSAFFGWMCQILTNLHSNDNRRKARQGVVCTGETPDIPDESAEGEAYRALDASFLRDAIETLPEDIRKTLLLHYFMDMPVKEVARVLSSPTSTITWRLHYARKILAAKLGAAAKKPGGKALLLTLALAAITAAGAATSLAVVRLQSSPAAAEQQADNSKDSGHATSATGGATSPLPAAEGGDPPATPLSNSPTLPLSNSTQEEQTMNTTLRTIAASAAFAAAGAQATNLCYRTPSTTPYTWNGGTWITHTNKVVMTGYLPTPDDNVFIWGTSLKADQNDDGDPLCVASGEVALTKDFTIGWNGVANSSSNNKILFDIQDGGVMTNSGAVALGVVENDYTKRTNPGGLATVRSGGSWVAQDAVTVGASSTGNRNRIVIEQNGAMEADSGKKEFIVANVSGHSACVTNAGALAVYDFFCGGYGDGDFENSGDFTVGRKFTIGRQPGSHGHVRHSGGTFTKGTPSSQPIHVGYNGIGVFEVFGALSLQPNERIILGGTGTGDGTLVLGAGGSIDNVTNVSAGAFSSGARGHLRLAGGTLTIQAVASGSPYALLIGKIGSSTGAQQAWGDISGYGVIARSRDDRDVRIKLYGKAIADGGDLDLSAIKTVGEKGVDANVCGTNGWYAVNGGRLLYPSAQDFGYAEHTTIGDYVYRGGVGNRADDMAMTLVNALQLRLFDANGDQLVDGKYNHAALYASDQADIPGRVPGSTNGDTTLGVWRIGHFDAPGDAAAANPVPFGNAWLRFRLDTAALPDDIDWRHQKVRLFRWDGTTWRIVGTALAADMPYVATETQQPGYDDDWNVGWYAAALVRNGATTIIMR